MLKDYSLLLQGSVAGYGESSVYGQSGYGEYGQQAPTGAAGQKRSNPYQQVYILS